MFRFGNNPDSGLLPGEESVTLVDGDFPIMAAIAAHPATSFEVLDHLHSIGVKASRSTLYRRVDSLIGEGYLVGEDVVSESGHRRRTLRLSMAGREWLGDEVSRVLRYEPLESPVFALALGCVGEVDREALSNVLRPRMDSAARRLIEEQGSLPPGGGDAAYWTQIGRRRRIAHLEADVNWLQSLLGRRSVTATDEPEPRRTETGEAS